jgi:hypothetical protein
MLPVFRQHADAPELLAATAWFFRIKRRLDIYFADSGW